MYKCLFIGNKIIDLESVESTNSYLKKLLTETPELIEGLTVNTQNQTKGRGQRGNAWKSNPDKNLTFSFLLKPKILVKEQFIISKIISLGIVDFLNHINISNVNIKWPNDIYVEQKKVAGILIENTLKSDKIENCIVGVGLNVNQNQFDSLLSNAASLSKLLNAEFDLEDILKQLLFFIEKRYLLLHSNKSAIIDADYINLLYQINKLCNYQLQDKIVEGRIVGVSKIGKLQLKIADEVQEFDLKEIKFLF